ncbi:MAG: T9SS type A sorting domain-containing protein [Candidatus Zixiibacteriota bacterium]|nr:MAG: T9SS type A sorting domain-containing protein [candidate division Zixibacteria bacterium]
MIAAGSTIDAQDVYDIIVNDDNGRSDQSGPRVAVDADGNFVVLWTDKRNAQTDIYFQFFDSSGTSHGDNLKLNDDQAGAAQFEPAIDAGLSGTFAAVWKDYRDGNYPFDPRVYFGRIDTLQNQTNVSVNPYASDLTCESPDIAVFPDAGAVVVWADYRNDNWDIFGRRINADGEPAGETFMINDDTGIHQQHSPAVAVLGSGGFVAAWYDNRWGNDDIYAQRFDASGTPVGANLRVNDDLTDARQAFPRVAADGSGRFFIAWIDWKNGSYPYNPDVYLRRFDSSGAVLGPAKKISGSDNGRAQKDVSLCSDRMGNICIVWADSSTGQWDALARIVDYTGALDGASFPIHGEPDGRQLQPDVATDGYKFFFVWADYRSGNFDIYASIKQYNDPTLVPEPNRLEFVMELGGDLPPSETVSLTNAGYGELNWSADWDAVWFNVTPDFGITPDSLQVEIIIDTLPYGTYYSEFKLIDEDHNDSTGIVPVKLTVTAPLLDISPDTLYFKVLAELGNPDAQGFQVNNSGSGFLTWTASENASWIAVNDSTGSQSEILSVQPDITGLEYGDYFEPLIIESEQAVNSPETAWVHLELVGNLPFLRARPESLYLGGTVGETLSAVLEIVNPGSGSLTWSASAGEAWLNLSRFLGTDYDTIDVTVLTEFLSAGEHFSEIIISDSSAFNQEIAVPVEILLLSGDTVQFLNTNTIPGGIAVMPLFVNIHRFAKGGYIPFACDTAAAILDSIVINEHNLPAFIDFYVGQDPTGRGEVGFRVMAQMIDDSTIPGADYHIADLFFTAADTNAVVVVDTTSSDSSAAYILTWEMAKTLPVVVAGELLIGSATSVEGGGDPLRPMAISVGQNFPNPFNDATTFEITLPRTVKVSVEIFNLLGQEVCRLFGGELCSGAHRLKWDGRLESRHPAPSGIYFYRVTADGFSDVRKMILLK